MIVYLYNSRRRPFMPTAPALLDATPVIGTGRPFPRLALTALVSGEPGRERAPLATADYHGRWKVVLWWPLQYLWSCMDELRGFAARRQEFADHDAALIGAAPETRSLLHSW